MEAIRSSETLVHTRSTQRYIPEDGILHSHRRENLKSYLNKDEFRTAQNLTLQKRIDSACEHNVERQISQINEEVKTN
jgi:hypothetical protein